MAIFTTAFSRENSAWDRPIAASSSSSQRAQAHLFAWHEEHLSDRQTVSSGNIFEIIPTCPLDREELVT
jgi:hypothetical protein